MAAISWADVLTVDASLVSTDPALQLVLLDLVNAELVNVRVFGGEESKRTKLVRTLLAAHFAKVFGQVIGGENVGPVTSRSGGGISKSMAAAAMTDDGLQRSAHGQLYQFLVKRAPLAQAMRG